MKFIYRETKDNNTEKLLFCLLDNKGPKHTLKVKFYK